MNLYIKLNKETVGECYSWPSWWRIAALSSTILAVEFAYAVEAGYGTPNLLKTGLPERYATFMWSTGPVLGIIFQGYLGSASDKCTSSWGKRKPFILFLGVIVLFALGLFPYVSSDSNLRTIVYTCGLFACMDFSLDAIQSPTRALLLDSLSEERTYKGNLMYTTMIGVGATLGSIISAIPWKTFGGESGDNFETQTKVVFGLTVGLFFFCLVSTLFSVNENQTKVLRLAMVTCAGEEESGHSNSNTDFAKGAESTNSTCCIFLFLSNFSTDLFESFHNTVIFVKSMSIHFSSLWLYVILTFFSNQSFYLFATEYVASEIYGGIANSDDPHKQELYDEGVRAGCWCLAVCNSSMFVSAMLMELLVEYFQIQLRTIVLFTNLFMLLASGVALVLPSLWTTVMTAFACGLLFTTFQTVPFFLVSHYEVHF